MTIPTAVSPSTLTPGLYLTIDLLAGTASPSTGELLVAVMATQSSAGDLTDNTEVRLLGGEADASTAFGPGTVGHLACKRIYDKYGQAQVYAVSPLAGAGTATLDITSAGAPTSNQTVDVDICGRTFEVTWLVGEDADDFRDKLIAAINQRTSDLPCTAVSGGAGVTTINSKVTGNVGNDILVKAKLRLAQTGTETLTGAVTHTNLAGGSADPDYTLALQAMEGQEFHYIVPCLSNTDAANVAGTNNAKRIYTHITNLNTGKDSKLQQSIVGYTGSLALARASAPNSNSFNNAEYSELLLCIDGRSLPGELGGREAGGRLASVSIDPAGNRIGEALDGIYGAYDTIGDKPTFAESESALGDGVSLVDYNAQGAPVLLRPITTHSQDAAGGPDRRLLDVQNVDASYIIMRDLRSALPIEFANAKIQADALPQDDPPPAGVTEERDIKAFIIQRLRFWEGQGVIQREPLNDAIENGTLIVQVNASDPTQVDCVVPFEVIQPLAKTGVVGQRIPS
jgi:phage tail sheath gpL-like